MNVHLYGKLGFSDSLIECSSVVEKVFEKLVGMETCSKILIDEIHFKPGVQYQGGHLFGFSSHQPGMSVITILGLLIGPLMGKPAFIARLIPVFSLTGDLLYEQINMSIKIIHDANGVVYSVMSDNLRANQSKFTLFCNNYRSKSIYSVNHPVPNIEFAELFLLYDPVHLLKNIRNNWCTEKSQRFTYFDAENNCTGIASWWDLISIYQRESEGVVKETTLSCAALYPTNFEKQKVSLALQVFNEKTVTALKTQDSKETARFVQLVLKDVEMIKHKVA